MDYPTPDGVRCKTCNHYYAQYPDRSPGCPQCEAKLTNTIRDLEEENKALRVALEQRTAPNTGGAK